ncbi:MAG: CDP-archaeol synthase [Gemmataceae bacterium]
MIRTRLIVGTILAIAAGGILIGDDYLSGRFPFPCLFVCLLALGVLAGREITRLIPEPFRPSDCLVVTGTLLCIAANWAPAVFPTLTVWPLLVFTLTATLMLAMLLEMHRYTGDHGHIVPRLGTTLLAVAYLGVLPCFFAQIRFLPREHTALLLALTIFVPKGNDIAAFFTGTFLGRHKMTPLLSPKKTWEGFAGGMTGGVLVAVGISFAVPVFAGGVLEAVGFGLAVGLAGVLGDLAESLIKRDCQMKDASKSIPGFGGLLDVVDSVLFAAPIAYLWFGWN